MKLRVVGLVALLDRLTDIRGIGCGIGLQRPEIGAFNMAKFKGTDYERFLTHVIKQDDGCWIWKADIRRDGYGQYCWYKDKKRTRLGAHRASWQFVHGPITDGLFVLHKCDVRRCVNPDHLFLGTQKDNVQDCLSKNRLPTGERHYNSKLTEEQVRNILRLSHAGFSVREIARSFPVHERQVGRIIRGERWASVVKEVRA